MNTQPAVPAPTPGNREETVFLPGAKAPLEVTVVTIASGPFKGRMYLRNPLTGGLGRRVTAEQLASKGFEAQE